MRRMIWLYILRMFEGIFTRYLRNDKKSNEDKKRKFTAERWNQIKVIPLLKAYDTENLINTYTES